MARSVLLLINRTKPDVVAALDEIRTLITRTGKGSIVGELDADASALPPQAAKTANVVVVLGGDGTLMAQARRCVVAGVDLPLLGVNLGKLGFMAEFDLPSLRAQAAKLFGQAPLLVQDRPMLRAIVRRDGLEQDVLARSLALNDAVVTAGPPYRMITLGIRIDGHAGPTVTGDGLIVASPIGSTAYNASAGGPIVSPEVAAITITAIAPHTLSFRPVVVGLDSTIELDILQANDETDHTDGPLAELGNGGGGTALVLDGQVPTRLRTGDVVVIRRHDRFVRFVRNSAGNYWATLINKMKWASPPAVRSR
jgi:NAD+ kinase